MFYLLRRGFHQIFINSWVSLWVLFFSFTAVTIPVEAQRQQSGTIYVNNLANLEAALNIIANGAELAGLIFGLILICHSAFFGKSDWIIPILKFKLNRYSQFFLGVGLIIIGLAIPGVINWLVAPTRCGG